MVAIYIIKPIEVNRFEVIKEDFYNFFLKQTCKIENKVLHILEDIIS